MMAGNPNWWNMHMHPPSSLNPHHQPSSLLSSSSTNSSSSSLFLQYVGVGGSPAASSLPQDSFADNNNHEQLPQSWSQLLMGGLSTGEEDKMGLGQFQATKRFSNWDDQILLNPTLGGAPSLLDVKQEEVSSLLQNNNNSNHHYMYAHGGGGGGIGNEEFQVAANWSHHMNINPVASSSPRSCVTSPSPSANILDFSSNKASLNSRTHQHHSSDHHSSSECNSTATGGACKKARVQSSSNLSPLKVRKEKLGDRITALHQLVSPFGKTDTASVLLEAIGYIRFLQSQIEALSSPYLGNGSGNTRNHQSEDENNKPKDLRSRGLCLVPVSCTLQDGNDNGADYWAPALGGGF